MRENRRFCARNFLRMACVAWAVALVFGRATLAQTTYTWNNTSGDGLWNTTSVNWTTNSVNTAWANSYISTGSRAVFAATGAGAVTLVDVIQANMITVNANAIGYVLQGGSLEIGAGRLSINESMRIESPITLRAAQDYPGWYVAVNKKLTILGNVNTSSKFVLGSSGVYEFFGTNTFNTGNNHWQMSGTTLNIPTGGVSTINCGTSSALIDGVVDVNGGTLSLNASVSRDGFLDGIYLGGNLYGGGTGTLNVRNGGLVELMRDNTYHITLGDNNSTTYSSTSGRGTINIEAGGVFLSARRFRKGRSINAAAAVINFDGGALKARDNVSNWVSTNVTANIKNRGAIIDTQAFDATIKQPLLAFGGDSTGGLRKVGSGTLTLSGTNTYNGVTDVTAGTLKLTNPDCLSTNTDLHLTTGATVDLAFTGTNTIGALRVDGQEWSAKVWHAGNSSGFLTGTGYLRTLLPPPRGTMIVLQ